MYCVSSICTRLWHDDTCMLVL